MTVLEKPDTPEQALYDLLSENDRGRRMRADMKKTLYPSGVRPGGNKT